MTDVVKRNGKKQKFSKAKLEKSVEKAAKEAKVSAAHIKTLVKEISEGVSAAIGGRKSIKSAELRRKVLDRLGRRSKAAVAAWRRYDKKRRK